MRQGPVRLLSGEVLTESEMLSEVPGTLKMEGENQLLQVSSVLHIGTWHVHPSTHKLNE